MILVGTFCCFIQVTDTQANSKFEGFGLLLASDLKTFMEVMLCLIQILSRS